MRVIFQIPLWVMLLVSLVSSVRASELAPPVDYLESLTEEEAVLHAVQFHPKLAKAEAHLRQAESRLAESRGWFRPSVSLYAGRRFDSVSHRFGVQVSQDLDGLWDRSKEQQAQAQLSIAQQDLVIVRQEVVREVSAAYDGWVLAKLKVHRAALRRVETCTILEHAQEQYDEGLMAASRLAELEKSSTDAEQASAESYAHLSEAALRLRQAMGEVGSPC